MEDYDFNFIFSSTESEPKEVNISDIDIDESESYDEYIKRVDNNIEEMKKRLEEKYRFKKTVNEDKIKQKFEDQFQQIIKQKQKELENQKVIQPGYLFLLSL